MLRLDRSTLAGGALVVALSGSLLAPASRSATGDDSSSTARFHFEDATNLLGEPKQAARNVAYGLAAGDLDGDGRLDLLLMNHGKPPGVLLNRHPAGFVDIQPRSGLTIRNAYPGQRDRHGASMGDYDNDGWTDLLVTHGGGRGSTLGIKFDQLLRNLGGRFEIVSQRVGLLNRQGRSRSARLVDFDRDGLLDAYIGNLDSANVLYRATPEGAFVDVTATSGLPTQGAEHQSWTDLDDDGWPDLMTCNPPRLFRNHGDGTFRELPLPPELAATGIVAGMAWGDWDGDGDDDLFTASPQEGRSRLWENRDGTLVAASRPFSPRGSLTDAHWVDLDLDGDLDLLVAATARVHIYENRGGRLLTEPRTIEGRDPPVPGLNGAVALVDLDLDGDLDLAVNSPRRAYLLWNDSAVGAGLTLRLVGRRSNRSAFGSRVETRSAERTQVRRYFGSSNGSKSTGTAPLVFGLGTDGEAAVSIRWPSGIRQRLARVPADRTLVLPEPDGTAARLKVDDLPMDGAALLSLETREGAREWIRRVQLQIDSTAVPPVAEALGIEIAARVLPAPGPTPLTDPPSSSSAGGRRQLAVAPTPLRLGALAAESTHDE